MVISVIGDVMLDVSESGEVSRVSPEAPVVILSNTNTVEALGGAANTAANVFGLGHSARIIGSVGTDWAGDICHELTRKLGLQDALLPIPGIPTTVKKRYLAGGQQIMRVDTEAEISEYLAYPKKDDWTLEQTSSSVALIFSDYNKGFVSEKLAVKLVENNQEIPIIVDTKRHNVSCFKGSTIIAPNHHEAAAISGEKDPRLAAEYIHQVTESSVLITLGSEGMYLLDEGVSYSIPSEAIEVADVTGAGDTVTAALAVALSEGQSCIEAAKWANRAAAIAVAHRGTHIVEREHLS